APEPEYRSSTRTPSSSPAASRELNNASRTSSVVGLVPLGGTRNFRPPAFPATILVTPSCSHPAQTAGRGRGRTAIAYSRSSPFPRRGVRGARVSESRIKRAEIAIEQAHVDRVYVRLAELRAQAEAMRARGYELGHGAQREAVFEQASMLYERDMMVFHANQTLQTLDAEYEGLVFGSLGHIGSETVYVGRHGIRDAGFNNLVTDWQAPAAAAFYQATAEEPMGEVRRRVIRCSGQSVLDIDDDVLMPEAVPDDMNV